MLALRALGVGPGRRGRRALLHLLRLARRRSRSRAPTRVLRRGPGHVLRHGRHGARGAHPGHEGGDRRAPVRQRRAGARDRGARRARAWRTPRRPPARAAPRAPPARSARVATLLLLPVEEPRRLRRRRRGRHDRRRRSPSACGCCASTARATSVRSSSSATTRGSTSCRRRSCASQLPHLDGWCRRPPRRRAPLRARRASASSSRCPCPPPAPTRPGTSTWSATSGPTTWAPRSQAAGIGQKAYYRVPIHRQPAMRRVRAGGAAAGHRRGRPHAPRHPDEPGAHARAGGRGRRRGARCASGST